jgi:protein-S-isoprenylcysteine O-methyltransferase Ste14
MEIGRLGISQSPNLLEYTLKWDKWAGKRGEGYVVVQFVLFGLIALTPLVLRPSAPWPEPWHTIALVAGLVFMGMGLLLAMVGVWSLGDNITAVPHPKENAQMVEHGAYRLVRHPIYSGIILGASGWGLVMNNWPTLLLTLLLLLLFDAKSRREELWQGHNLTFLSPCQMSPCHLVRYGR